MSGGPKLQRNSVAKRSPPALTAATAFSSSSESINIGMAAADRPRQPFPLSCLWTWLNSLHDKLIQGRGKLVNYLAVLPCQTSRVLVVLTPPRLFSFLLETQEVRLTLLFKRARLAGIPAVLAAPKSSPSSSMSVSSTSIPCATLLRISLYSSSSSELSSSICTNVGSLCP
jgi:hypothetical protein